MKFYFADIGRAYYACQNYASLCGFLEWEDSISSENMVSLTNYKKIYIFLINCTSKEKFNFTIKLDYFFNTYL